MIRSSILLAVALLAGCVIGTHDPATIEAERPLVAEDFDRVVDLVLKRGFRPLNVDHEARKLSSDWIDTDTPTRPGLRRLYLDFVDGERIELLVEVKWIRLGVLNDPYWTSPEVDYAEENELIETLESLLGS